MCVICIFSSAHCQFNFFSFCCVGVTSSYSEDLLALCSEITHGKLGGPYRVPGTEFRLVISKTSTLLTICSLAPIWLFFFMVCVYVIAEFVIELESPSTLILN